MAATAGNGFTRGALIIGVVAMIVVSLGAKDHFRDITAYYFSIFNMQPYEGYRPMNAAQVLVGSIPAFVGLVFCRLSSLIDNPVPDGSKSPAGRYMIAAVLLLVLYTASISSINYIDEARRTGQESNSPLYALALLLGIFGALFAWPLSYIIMAVSFGVFLGGVFCLPRAMIVMTSSTPLRRPWETRSADGIFDGRSVAAALGHASSSEAHSRAVRRDLAALKAEAEKLEDELRRKRDLLKSQALSDIARAREEAEVADMLERIDTLATEIRTLTTYRKGRGYAR